MRKTLILLILFLSFLALFLRFGYQPIVTLLNLTPRAGLRVESNPKAKVTICPSKAPCASDQIRQLGTTPLQDENLKSGEYLVSLLPDESTNAAVLWQGYVKLNGGTLSVVNREIGASKALSSGEVITLEKGQGATIISNPAGADVVIDGKAYGKTPVSVPDLTIGEHQFLIGKDNFLKRSIRATVVSGYSLNLAVDLAVSEADLTKLPTVPIVSTSQVVVKPTSTGFLRVRSAPNLNSQEVTRVTPGQTLTLLEELPNWFKIRLPDGKEGYVSSSFVEKKTN